MLQRNRQGILVMAQRGTKLIQAGLPLAASERVSTDCILIIHLEFLSLTKKVFWWEKEDSVRWERYLLPVCFPRRTLKR